jgi:enoyl-CoA hydratase/carnithine racemase
MAYNEIIFEKKDGVAKIILNRQDSLNAFSEVMREEFKNAIDHINSDREVRVVVITGAGKAFSAGGDIKTMADRCNSNISFQERRDFMRRATCDPVRKLRSIRQPVIAAINGAAVGAGCGLALACDIRIASEKATLGLAFVKRGLTPDWGAAYFLPRLIGPAKALELVCTGRLIDANTAFEMGLVNKVIPHEEFDEQVNYICDEITQNAPIAVAAAKSAILYGLSYGLDLSLEYETYLASMCQLTEDHREGVMSFIEKRSPIFKGI